MTRGKGSVIITPKPESVYDRWVRDGLVLPGSGRLDEAPTTECERPVAEVMAEVGSDH